MSDPIEKARKTQAASITTITGRTLADLHRLMAGWGQARHGEMVSRAKEEFGLTHGHANFLVHAYRERLESEAPRPGGDPIADALDRMYVGSKASVRSLHEQLMERLQALGTFEIAPKKSYLSLRRKKQFATVGPGTRGRLEIGINNRGAEPTMRLEELPAGKMCSHRIYVGSVEELDDELVRIVHEAYEGAA